MKTKLITVFGLVPFILFSGIFAANVYKLDRDYKNKKVINKLEEEILYLEVDALFLTKPAAEVDQEIAKYKKQIQELQ